MPAEGPSPLPAVSVGCWLSLYLLSQTIASTLNAPPPSPLPPPCSPETVASEGRLDLVKRLPEKAHQLRASSSKSIDATVTSAVALTKDQQAAITKNLPSHAPTGFTLNVKYSVDPAILGGLLVSFNNQSIDLSSSSRLVEVVAGANQ